MKNIEELRTYGDDFFVVSYKDDILIIVEKDRYDIINFSGEKDFYLFDCNLKNIGHLNFILQHLNGKQIKERKDNGWLDVPEYFVILNEINIKDNYRDNHLGNFLLNYGIKDLMELSKWVNKELPITFIRINTPVTRLFYKKWGAEYNEGRTGSKRGFSYMIIKSPKPKEEYEGKVIYKSIICEDCKSSSLEEK